jgi:ADP-ribosylglycohydrolase
MQTAAQIFVRTDGDGVTEVVQIPADHAFKEVAGLPFGSTSDDWGMTAATARAIISHGPRDFDKFFQLVLARELADELRRCDIGYGTGTKVAIRQMDTWLRGNFKEGRSPLDPAPRLAPLPGKKQVGSGNGVAIRIGPVGMALGFVPQSQPVLMSIGRMTHSDPRASIAGTALAMFFERIVRWHRSGLGTERIINMLRSRHDFKDMIENLRLLEHEHRANSRKASTHILTNRLRKVLLDSDTLAFNTSLRRTVGNSVLCWESVPYAIGVFLRNLDDPQAAIREAVNGGGDTDSIASIVGSLMGLLHGLAALPTDWKEGKDAECAATLGYRFHNVLTGGRL